MAVRIRFQYITASSLGYSIERLSDGTYFDFVDGMFRFSPAKIIAFLTEDASPFKGRYRATIDPTPASQFTDGNYAVNVHDVSSANVVIGELGVTITSGDDMPSPVDPWSSLLPGSYSAGTAGSIIGNYVDAKISTRSIYNGGAVASVTAPVTVGVNGDKTGYQLSAAGLDAITVEQGINARQALNPILAAAAGTVTGAGTGTIVIKGGNSTLSRITASSDNLGNRMGVTLNLPS